MEEDGDIEVNEELNVAATRHIVLKDKTHMHVQDNPVVLHTYYYTLTLTVTEKVISIT